MTKLAGPNILRVGSGMEWTPIRLAVVRLGLGLGLVSESNRESSESGQVSDRWTGIRSIKSAPYDYVSISDLHTRV